MSINLFGCKFKISFFFVAFFTSAIFIDKSGGIAWGIVSTAIHELGHILVMIQQGSKPKKIKFSMFDINIVDYESETRNYKNEIFLMLAGPLANFLFAVIFYIAYAYSYNSSLLLPLYENFILGFFNLLPIVSLDGGKILFIILANKMDEHKAVKILDIISFIFILLIAMIGFYILLESKYNFSLLFVSCYLMAILLLKENKIIFFQEM